MDCGVRVSVRLMLLVATLGYSNPISAADANVYLRCSYLETSRVPHADGSKWSPGLGSPEIYRINGNSIEQWASASRVFKPVCDSWYKTCLSGARKGYYFIDRVHTETAPPHEDMRDVRYIDRYTGEYSGETRFSQDSDPSPFMSLRGKCVKTINPELQKPKF